MTEKRMQICATYFKNKLKLLKTFFNIEIILKLLVPSDAVITSPSVTNS